MIKKNKHQTEHAVKLSNINILSTVKKIRLRDNYCHNCGDFNLQSNNTYLSVLMDYYLMTVQNFNRIFNSIKLTFH